MCIRNFISLRVQPRVRLFFKNQNTLPKCFLFGLGEVIDAPFAHDPDEMFIGARNEANFIPELSFHCVTSPGMFEIIGYQSFELIELLWDIQKWCGEEGQFQEHDGDVRSFGSPRANAHPVQKNCLRYQCDWSSDVPAKSPLTIFPAYFLAPNPLK